MLSSAQVQAAGLGRPALRRLLSLGEWQRLDRSVYLTYSGEPSWLAWAWAGLLLGGEGARLTGTSAGYLHGLVEEEPPRIRVLTQHGEVLRSRQRWVFVRERPGVRERRSIGSPARTTVEDTVLDLCDGGSAEAALSWVTRAVQERRTTTARLGQILAGRRRARHRALLRDLLADVAQGAETPLEIRYLRDVERAHRLPVGQRQDQLGRFWRDVAYRKFATVVELDGRLGHDGLGRFRDMARDNWTVVWGQATLRYGVPDVMLRPCAVASQVALVLQRGGWAGTLVRCPRCPPSGIVWTSGD